MKIINDTSEINWVDKSVNLDSSADKVDFIIPNIFDRYFKLFLPIGIQNEESKTENQITYRQLAELAELKYNKSFSIIDIEEKFGGIPEDLTFKKFDNKFIDELGKTLKSNSNCIFHGFGDDIVPDEFELPWVIKGKMSDFKEVVERLNYKNDWTLFNFYPNYIFDTNNTWFLGWRVMVNEVGIIILGCNLEIAKKLGDNTNIDFEELFLNDNYLKFRK